MTVGIVGLGLIGGSFAKAYAETGHTVLAADTDRSTLDYAKICGTVSGALTEENISTCDLVLIAIFPEAAIAYLRKMAPYIGPHTVVIDCCGTKRVVCAAAFPLAKQHGFTFLGGHPMAGNHHSGFKYARANLYHNAPMVIVPADFDDIALLDRVKHHEMIAFTSQLAHVVSNAYIKSPTAGTHKGFSAGSYKDLTRVAWLNPHMWAELFLENKDYLMDELDGLIAALQQYREAMADDDLPRLVQLLDDGRRRKEEVDGR